MKRIIITLFLILQITSQIKAQLILVPSSYATNQQTTKNNTINYNQLPFVEDFSNYQGLPNPLKWQSSNAIVNFNYQYNPPTIGVVTLDAIDNYGKLYPGANTSSFNADTLLSQPVRLDSVITSLSSKQKLSKGDSIYFSFYIQPAGGGGQPWETIGSSPSSADSILLEFYSEQDGWQRIWAMGGIPLDTLFAQEGAYYKYVLIPIVEDKYFIKDFKFRFRNLASLNNNPQVAYVANCDQWNIDYIYINKDRNQSDSTLRELAFVETAPSMLKRYQSIPAKQYTLNEVADKLQIKIVNLHSEALSSLYKYDIKDASGNIVHAYDGGFENISPYIVNHTYQDAVSHANPSVNYDFNLTTDDWKTFKITHTIKEGVGQDVLSANDTITFTQKFEDYFAYDDGSAENGIGVEPISGSHLAVSYHLNQEDTLSAVDIYFNSALNEANLKPFYLCVWTSFENQPLNLIHKTEKLTPVSDSLNKFVRYELEEGIILGEGDFFVSIETKGNDYLNIGFDRNTNSSQYTYSKAGVDWQQSFIKGSVMIRPYFGYKALVGLESENEALNFNFYPNPTSSKIFFQGISGIEKQILDISGRQLLSTYENQIDLSSLKQGIYILRVESKDGIIETRKIVKTK